MFDFGIGTPELLVIAMVALIVIGPKDLPRLLRTIGQYVGKLKSMAREFQDHLEDAAKEAGVDDLKESVSKATDFDFDEDFRKQEEQLAKVFETSAAEPDTKPKSAKDKPDAGKKKAKKPAAKKPAAKKTAAKKAAAKKPAAKKTLKG